MMTRIARVALLGALLLAACGAPPDGWAGLGHKRSALDLPNTGLIPYPVQVGDDSVPLSDPQGRPIPAWDGSVVDLMAADAWAMCANGTSRTLADDGTEADSYLNHLKFEMKDAFCDGGQMYSSTDPITTQWWNQRKTAKCNVDTSTLEPTAVHFATHQSYKIQNVSDLTYQSPGTSTTVDQAIAEAQKEVDVADVNLCMAQRLRDYQTSADGLFATGADQRELLEVIRQRSQVAMLQYALLGLAFANQDPRPDAVTSPLQILEVFHAWKGGTPDNQRAMGSDFAAAIQLHTQVVKEETEYLLRTASSREVSDSTDGSTQPDLDWGAHSWRTRVLALLYGGDPLFAASGLQDRSWALPDYSVAIDDYSPPYVDTSMRAAEVTRLLGLARAADALYLAKAFDNNVGAVVFDVDYSANQLYRRVEAYLRRQQCKADNPGSACDIQADDSQIPDPGDYADYLLWKEQRIKPVHARTLVKALYQGLSALDIIGAESTDTPAGGSTAYDWLHVDKAFYAQERPNDSRRLTGGIFGVHYRMPLSPVDGGTSVFDKTNVARTQGFVARWAPPYDSVLGRVMRGPDGMRYLGALEAEVLTRHAIALMHGNSRVTNYLHQEGPMLGALEGNVGKSTMVIEPRFSVADATSDCAEWMSADAPFVYNCPKMVLASTSSGSPAYEVQSAVETGDTRQLVVDPSPDRDEEYALAASEKFVGFDGASAATTLDLLPRQDPYRTVGTGDRDLKEYLTGTPISNANGIVFDAMLTDGTHYTPPLAFQPVYRTVPVSGGTAIRSFDSMASGNGGALGDRLARAFATLSSDWSRPAFDGFGLRTNWVPPTDPALYGGNAGTDAVSFYLAAAKGAADEATAAVQTSITALLQQQSDATVAAAANQQAQQLDNLEQQKLCGPSTSCSFPSIAVLSASVVPPIDCSTTSGSYAMCDYLANAVASRVPHFLYLAKPVADTLGSAAVPGFEDFDGGTLQSLLIQQATAVRELGDLRDAIQKGIKARAKEYQAAEANLAGIQANEKWNCSDEAFHEAVDAGKSCAGVHENVNVIFADQNAVSWYQQCDSTSWSGGPVIAQFQKCQDLKTQLAPAQAQTVSVLAEAWYWASQQVGQVTTKVAGVMTSIAAVRKAGADANIATKTNDLEAALKAEGLTTRFGTFRKYHSYDIWRARALLDSARRYAVAARRAIEAKYAVDLSNLSGDEAFVASPKTWADDVYRYDLDPPSAVGLSVGAQPGGIYPNQIADYVENLDRFVKGYAVSRPAASAKSDTTLLTIDGPDASTTDTNGDNVLKGDDAAWSFYCQNAGAWVSNPGLSGSSVALVDACGSGDHISQARVTFSLDPWFRMDTDVAQDPPDKRFNARWGRLAVNLVGTGVKDCTAADDPYACYADPSIPFDLAQQPPSWVGDYNREWVALGEPEGQIEAGKALAAELWLDPVKGFSDADVADVARQEFNERPSGGVYVLDLQIGPEVRLDRIERVQILAEMNYWVRQD